MVDHAVRAEAAGFDQLVMSDHYYPWLDAQGHSPYAWSVLGAVAHATSRAELMSFVTCPIRRYHPAVVAQKASTIGVLSDGRFTLGLGAGENLNEHVVGGWPHVQDELDRTGARHPRHRVIRYQKVCMHPPSRCCKASRAECASITSCPRSCS